MTLNEAYKNALTKLKNPKIDEISVRILLCANNNIPTMSGFYFHKNDEVVDLDKFNRDFDRFLNGEPVQYILNSADFLSLNLYVDKRVLIPRQETEEVATQAMLRAYAMFGDKVLNVADVCCGSGALGIWFATKMATRYLFFSDISCDAIEVAKINAQKHNIIGNFYVGDALDKLIEKGAKVDVLLANPPYILSKEDVDQSVLDNEPHLALFADEELSVYRKIISNLPKIKDEKLLAVFEIGYDLKEKLQAIILECLPECNFAFSKDINGKERILVIKLS